MKEKAFYLFRGSLPDMTSDTNNYVKLAANVTIFERCRNSISTCSATTLLLKQPSDNISEAYVKNFCKHASSIAIQRGSSLSLEQPDSMMVYYVMLRAIDRFFDEYNAYPGEFDDQLEVDIIKMKSCISKLLSEWSCGPLSKDDYVHEICRYGGAELHSVSAFIAILN
ncbi:hypothetical protein LSTR_LSTR013708 [Laodelphax striatellus]|uniref:Uncharacterized protein n=1 Tax=Laodelphax striatellus TaxID=195883 RepID=A0A482XM27_LAOST|nr:hypothetical protein LSTR_LSTR013708 [Laodelphax striatellus]